uniref:Uncharacterized protein n=1 Tax=viral metagenome TaxID=1070528 RepID=A0A6C0KDU6_9ZZZZ
MSTAPWKSLLFLFHTAAAEIAAQMMPKIRTKVPPSFWGSVACFTGHYGGACF